MSLRGGGPNDDVGAEFLRGIRTHPHTTPSLRAALEACVPTLLLE